MSLQSTLQAALNDRFIIEREIGRGGMSLVYLARDLRNKRFVALKALRPELAATLGHERFLQEITVAAGLTHPHILPLFDSGEAAGLLFYTMPYVEGESLRHRLSREGRLPIAEAVNIACEVADALSYAHARNIVHRDIKPENILLEAGHAVVSDFGIARAISVAGEDRITGTGIVIGTVDYMSPEQATGQDELDGRSDIYSLACVLYEMLVGRTPFAGRTPTGVIGAHRSESPPSVTTERQEIPLEVELAIETALAKVPSERYATASEFAAALKVPMPVSTSGRWFRRLRRRMQPAFWTGLAVTALLGAFVIAALPKILRAGLDPALYVVVPFGHLQGAAPSLVNGDRCESLLIEAFGRWNDLRIVDDLRVHDLRMRRGSGAVTFDQALAIAREVKSGRLIWGDVAQFGDSVEVRGVLYDVTSGARPIRQHSVRFGADGREIGIKFRELADSLLIGQTTSPQVSEGVVGTRSVAAWQAYEEGHAGLATWNLQAAEVGFRAAIQVDPQYPHAHFWLAQTLAWAGRPASEWRPYALTGAAGGAKLGIHDRSLAQALVHLANQEFMQACAQYRTLLRRDSLDFAAWFGLGECQTKDRLVVRDPTGPSGWRFRSSYPQAAIAYQRALELIPSVHRAFTGVAFTRLTRLFYAESNVHRRGYALTPDTTWFAAWPGLNHDSLTFSPYPLSEMASGRPGTVPATAMQAITHNRQVLRSIATSWVGAFPNSPDAHEALGRVLETQGELAGGSSTEPSALRSIRIARGVATSEEQQVRLATAEVRLLVKLEDFRRARMIAESVIVTLQSPLAAESEELAGLAALTGHVFKAAELQRRKAGADTMLTWNGEPVIPPRPVAEPALALLAFASFGTPRESLVTYRRRTEQQIQNWIEDSRKLKMRVALLHMPSALAFPEVGLTDLHGPATGGNYILALQWMLGRGDTMGVRNRFASLAELRRDLRPGDLASYAAFHEVLLLLAMGDSVTALRRLDASLAALPTFSLDVVSRVFESASLVRMMVLRADLAARQADRPAARRWASAVLDLWAHADNPLQPTLDRMRSLRDM